MSEIKWQDPPDEAKRGRASSWDPIRETLKANPGKWALVAADAATSTASAQRRPGFEFVSRSKPGYKAGRSDIYGRYVGSDE